MYICKFNGAQLILSVSISACQLPPKWVCCMRRVKWLNVKATLALRSWSSIWVNPTMEKTWTWAHSLSPGNKTAPCSGSVFYKHPITVFILRSECKTQGQTVWVWNLPEIHMLWRFRQDALFTLVKMASCYHPWPALQERLKSN